MDAPEYLDLDEIDFTDDVAYSVTSLKSIPELCRRSDSQSEERPVPSINWSRSIPSHGGNGIKPTGIAEVHSKFRPVKRVSPLKHQPEVSDVEPDGKTPARPRDDAKEDVRDKAGEAGGEVAGLRGKTGGGGGGALFGELEHYDLDMDEILDVPYIKSSQQTSTLPRTAARSSTLPHTEALGSLAHYCVLSPVKCPDMRKSKTMEPNFLRQPSHAHNPLTDPEKLLPRAYPEPRPHLPTSQSMMFPLTGCGGGKLSEGTRAWGAPRAHGECDEEAKKAQNIINLIRGGQISLLPHLAVDNLELVRDEEGNNLLHISAAYGHADCLQHLTSLMGEDCLNERNNEQLTPAGLGIKNGHLECVRWMVSETEAIAELSCSREHPSLIHYAARYGQEKILLWLLQFMQEQAISLDELDQNGNSAVHVAAQDGHLGCIQTLVEYGSNVTVQNQQGERPSQTAERHGNSTCARYLVVVETCMSLASQVVKLTKQLNEQTTENVTLQSRVQQLLELPHREGSSTLSPSSLAPPLGVWPEMTLTAEAAPGGGQWVLRQRDVDSDTVLRQLLGKEISEKVCSQEKLSLEFREGQREAGRGTGAGAGRRELKLARLKQLMQRSLSESDSDAYPAQEQSRPDRPRQLPLGDDPTLSPAPSCTTTSPTADGSEHEHEAKATTSPKSALKSPSSRRKTSQSARLRVTFDEPVVHKEEPAEKGGARTAEPASGGESWKRPFGTFRSIMESLGGNQNSNTSGVQTGGASPGRRGGAGTAKSKSKTSAV